MGTRKKKTRRTARIVRNNFNMANVRLANPLLASSMDKLKNNMGAMSRLGLSTMDGSAVEPKIKSFYWEHLQEAYEHTGRELISQLALCREMIEKFSSILKKAPDVNAKLIGLIKSYQDESDSLVENSLKHKHNGEFIKGKIDDNDIDAQMLYLNIAGRYIAIGEIVARLTATGLTDIMTEIMTDPRFKDDEVLKSAVADFKEITGSDPIMSPELKASMGIE